MPRTRERHVEISADNTRIEGDLVLPEIAKGVVLFAHGSGSSRFSGRNRAVARYLNERGFGTLLIDLLSRREEELDAVTRHLRFDIGLLADRLSGATEWLLLDPETQALPIGYFGASTGAAAALVASVRHSTGVHAIVSRGGRPDLAGSALKDVLAPTLLLVGSLDTPVIPLNETALEQIATPQKRLEIIEGATHLFEEPGKLEIVAKLTADWFERFLQSPRRGNVHQGAESNS